MEVEGCNQGEEELDEANKELSLALLQEGAALLQDYFQKLEQLGNDI